MSKTKSLAFDVGDRVRWTKQRLVAMYGNDEYANECGTVTAVDSGRADKLFFEVHWDNRAFEDSRWLESSLEHIPKEPPTEEGAASKFEVGDRVEVEPSRQTMYSQMDGLVGKVARIDTNGWVRVDWEGKDRDFAPLWKENFLRLATIAWSIGDVVVHPEHGIIGPITLAGSDSVYVESKSEDFYSEWYSLAWLTRKKCYRATAKQVLAGVQLEEIDKQIEEKQKEIAEYDKQIKRLEGELAEHDKKIEEAKTEPLRVGQNVIDIRDGARGVVVSWTGSEGNVRFPGGGCFWMSRKWIREAENPKLEDDKMTGRLFRLAFWPAFALWRKKAIFTALLLGYSFCWYFAPIAPAPHRVAIGSAEVAIDGLAWVGAQAGAVVEEVASAFTLERDKRNLEKADELLERIAELERRLVEEGGERIAGRE
jgi:DNA-binding transcriptional MerR regulator